RTDLFSLGSVLYTLCARRPPFVAETVAEVLKRVCEDEPAPLRGSKADVPAWLCQAIAKLHGKKACDRFASAREVADLLSARLARIQQPLLPTPEITAREPESGGRGRSPTPRSRKVRLVLAWLAVLAVMFAGVYAFVLWRQGANGPAGDQDSQ